MSRNCSGCCADITAGMLFIKCTKMNCNKVYDLKCIGIRTDEFETWTNVYKEKWVCPECVCSQPKPIRSADTPATPGSGVKNTFTSCSNVNTKRGNRLKTAEQPMVADTESNLMEFIKEFRSEVLLNFEVQTEAMKNLQKICNCTGNELRELRAYVQVLEEKVDRVVSLEKQLNEQLTRNQHLEQQVSDFKMSMPMQQTEITKDMEVGKKKDSTGPARTFAAATKQNQNRVVGNEVLTKECVATKPSNTEKIEKSAVAKEINRPENGRNQFEKLAKPEELASQKEGNWIEVNKKKNRYPNTEVKRGGSTSAVDIKGTERKKFLHVWRLCKETTVEKLEKYVKNICGSSVPVTVEVIRHKTERDYASFIIGVPESSYNTLCQSENWAVNIEFCEWVWFRTKKP